MPLYEYKCPKCNESMEIIHKVSETLATEELTCKCGELMVKALTAHQGYFFNGIDSGSSTRRKDSASFRRK